MTSCTLENHVYHNARSLVLLALLSGLAPMGGLAEDWPTFRHDNHRSGITRENLAFPLQHAWTYKPVAPPRKAWSAPAKWDSYAGMNHRKSMRDFDPVFYATIAGNQLFFGSSVDNAVHCLETANGREVWTFFTNGPVRVAPTVSGDRVFAGSDDGLAYCLHKANGRLQWKHRAAASDAMVLNNGTLMARWPCRTGVVVADNKAIFGASLFPWRPSYLCCVDSLTGKTAVPGGFNETFKGMTVQGPLLVSSTKIYAPQGQQRPALFALDTGRHIGHVGGAGGGGCFALLAPGGELIHGRGQNHGRHGELRLFDDANRAKDALVTFQGAVSMVVDSELAWFNTGDKISAFHRARYVQLNQEKRACLARRKAIAAAIKKLGKAKPPDKAQIQSLKQEDDGIVKKLADLKKSIDGCFLWHRTLDCPYEIILAGEMVFAGGRGRVVALRSTTGETVWEGKVNGRAWGLAVANGRLFVSTHTGEIACFKAP